MGLKLFACFTALVPNMVKVSAILCLDRNTFKFKARGGQTMVISCLVFFIEGKSHTTNRDKRSIFEGFLCVWGEDACFILNQWLSERIVGLLSPFGSRVSNKVVCFMLSSSPAAQLKTLPRKAKYAALGLFDQRCNNYWVNGSCKTLRKLLAVSAPPKSRFVCCNKKR